MGRQLRRPAEAFRKGFSLGIGSPAWVSGLVSGGGVPPPVPFLRQGTLKIGLDFDTVLGGPEAGFWMVLGSFS